MNYYIINNRIIPYDTELDTTLYSYPKLTKEQSDFYELHRCSLQDLTLTYLDYYNIYYVKKIF